MYTVAITTYSKSKPSLHPLSPSLLMTVVLAECLWLFSHVIPACVSITEVQNSCTMFFVAAQKVLSPIWLWTNKAIEVISK